MRAQPWFSQKSKDLILVHNHNSQYLKESNKPVRKLPVLGRYEAPKAF
jgi:hypothetical protein